jgi:protein-S-isoprenylcysteine O-methyltransferase Ste14
VTPQLGALAAGLVGFAVLHSILAAPRVRGALGGGRHPCAYRLAYNIVSVSCLGAVVPLLVADHKVLWRATGGWQAGLVALQVIAVAGFVYALRGFDAGAFLGMRGSSGAPARLQTRGAYALCRHPLYFCIGLFFSASPVMDAGRLVFSVWLWLYAWVGSVFEERRLADEFGAAYRAYQATHWRLLPLGPRPRGRAG